MSEISETEALEYAGMDKTSKGDVERVRLFNPRAGGGLLYMNEEQDGSWVCRRDYESIETRLQEAEKETKEARAAFDRARNMVKVCENDYKEQLEKAEKERDEAREENKKYYYALNEVLHYGNMSGQKDHPMVKIARKAFTGA